MRILFILHQFFPEFHGGTERVTVNLARMAQRAGHYVHVLACTVEPAKCGGTPTDGGGSLTGAFGASYQGLPVTLLPRAELPATADISLDTYESMVERLTVWMRQQRFDVAHVMHTMRMGSAVLAAQRCGLPYILTLTDFFLPCARINLINGENNPCVGPDAGRRCGQDCATAAWTTVGYVNRFAQAQAIIQAAGARVAPSEYVAQRYRDAFEDAHIQVISHGIDLLAMGAALDRLPPAPSATAHLNLLFIGSIVPQKGLDVLLRALALVPHANVKLKVVGGFFGNPAYHHQIKQLARMDSRVELTGALDAAQVFQALGQADLLCLPSIVPESFSLVFHEAAAVGVPALVTHLGAPAQHVYAHVCGRVLDAGNTRAWADAIDELVKTPETLRSWKKKLFLPARMEEEAFLYDTLYKRLRLQGVS